MAASKKPLREPSRHQPRRAASHASRESQPDPSSIITRPSAGSSSSKIHKAKRPSRPTQQQRKKLQQALLKKVDARDPKDAWTEQAGLLGLSVPNTSFTGPKPKTRDRKYVDHLLARESHSHSHSHDVDDLRRAERWIPNFEHRRRTVERPVDIPHAVWMAYQHLDELIYRQSLSRREIMALPLLEDVHAYQDSDGMVQRPVTPPGFRWDANLELEPIRSGFQRVSGQHL